mgnify:CR=1 FL=1
MVIPVPHSVGILSKVILKFECSNWGTDYIDFVGSSLCSHIYLETVSGRRTLQRLTQFSIRNHIDTLIEKINTIEASKDHEFNG